MESHEHRAPWNKGKLVGQKAPLKPKDIWAIRIHLQNANQVRDLALFNLAIDSKLRGCDLVALRVRDVTHGSQVLSRAAVVQRKTQRPVQFELTEPTRTTVATWIEKAKLKPEQFLFPSRLHHSPHVSTRQYARIVEQWVTAAGLKQAHLPEKKRSNHESFGGRDLAVLRSARDQGRTAGSTQRPRTHRTPARIPVSVVRHHLFIHEDLERGAHLTHLGLNSPRERRHEKSRWIEVQLQVSHSTKVHPSGQRQRRRPIVQQLIDRHRSQPSLLVERRRGHAWQHRHVAPEKIEM